MVLQLNHYIYSNSDSMLQTLILLRRDKSNIVYFLSLYQMAVLLPSANILWQSSKVWADSHIWAYSDKVDILLSSTSDYGEVWGW